MSSLGDYFLDQPEGDHYLDELIDEELLIDDGSLGLGEVLGEALRDEYADATPDELDAALLDVLETMTPAEESNFTSALRRIAAAGPPLAGATAGTLVGGPAGAAAGSKLGDVAAKALSGRPAAAAPVLPAGPLPAAGPLPPPAAPLPAATVAVKAAAAGPQGVSVASGSIAALQGLMLCQQLEVLKCMLALALGQHGCGSVAGMPVGAVMNMLSKTFEQAAADADELLEVRDDPASYLHDAAGESYADPASPHDRARALYSDLLQAENEYLAEPGGGR